MNIIEDINPDSCVSTAFARADDENGNMHELEIGECTDGDDSNASAPIELLAEFLSAVLQRNFPVALEYCEKILKFEPNNSVAREFQPLIKLRIETDNAEQATDEEDDGENSEGDGGSNEEGGSEECNFSEEEENTEDFEEEGGGLEDESSYDIGASSSDGTTDNFSMGEEDDDNDIKTDSNGNPTAASTWHNTPDFSKLINDRPSLDLLTAFKNMTLEQLRAQFSNGEK